MRNRILAILLVAVMAIGISACGTTPPAEATTAAAAPATAAATSAAPSAAPTQAAPEVQLPNDKVLVVGVDATFEEKWNPFLVESAYDHQVVDQVFASISQINDKNELIPYAGDISAEQNADGTVLYTITIKQGMTFTDGTPVTIDDYIYGLYVRGDPSYAGRPGSLLGSDIEGVKEYFYDDPNYTTEIAKIEEECAARYGTAALTWEDFLEYSIATNLDGWWNGDPAGDIGNGQNWSEYATDEGFEKELAAIDATNADQMLELIAKIEYTNYKDAYDVLSWAEEKAKSEYALGNLTGGVNVPEISGIKRVDDYTCTVKYTKIDIYADRGLAHANGSGSLVPRHYYGEFTKGDVSKILANMEPMGSGPYIWGGFADNIATCTANPDFFLGVPVTGTVRWQYVPQDEIIAALASGAIDIANPTCSQQNIEEMKRLGLNYHLVDNPGYGYMAMNTERVPLDVRKGYWCLMNRQPSVEGYYGPEIAMVIERPMTTTVAEYPTGATQYYPYSRDEALKYFEAAGYTQKDGKLVDAKGKQLVINTYIGGNGKGQHPAYAMLVQAAEDMKALGGEIQIQDVDFNVLQGAMNDGTADAWIMAWTAVYDCDKSSQFHSTGGQNRYKFKDAKMDNLLETIVQTVDLDARRALVSEMLDYAMENCLELPLYQRKNMMAYNTDNLVMETVPQATTSANYENVLWQVETLN